MATNNDSAAPSTMDEKVSDGEFKDGVVATQTDVEQSSEIDAVAEAKLVSKLDRWIIPPIMLLYLFSFLDRVNIGNARLYGIEEDLGMTGNQFQLAVSLLFVTYVSAEVPSNLIIKKMRPSRWIAFITVGWGTVATLMGIVQSFGGLIACRLILGALEAGLFPGMISYLTFFYTKREIALRVGYLFVSAAIAGSVGGLLAYAIGFMEGVAGYNGWRWIFIIEGIPTVVLGFIVWFWLADDSDSAYYLTDTEKALNRARKFRQVSYTVSGDQLHKADVIKGVKDWKIWAFCFGMFGIDTMLYGYSTFLPSIIRGFGKSSFEQAPAKRLTRVLGTWSSAQVQALTIPCYALGAVTYLVVAYFSDKYQQRGIVCVTFCCIAAIGYGILLAPASSAVHYFGTFVVATGLYVAVGIPLAWLPTNQPRYGKRTYATGMQLTFGNCAGIMAPFLYQTNEAPRYLTGHGVTLAMVLFSGIIFLAMMFYFQRRNKARQNGEEDHLIEGMTEDEIAELGDENPRFHFTY